MDLNKSNNNNNNDNESRQAYSELFLLYGKLANSVKQFEQLNADKQSMLNQRTSAQSDVSSAWISPLAIGFAGCTYLIIPFVIVFVLVLNFNSNADGVSWVILYDQWYATLPHTVWYNSVINPETTNAVIAFILGVIHYLLIEHVIFPALVILLPITIFAGIIYTVFSTKKNKKIIIELNSELEKIDLLINSLYSNLEEPISFVPPDYRYSDALYFFYNGYINARINTLQEAIEAYETHLHRKRVEQSQLDILSAQENILQQVNYQASELANINNKLNRMSSKLNDIDSTVSWL